MIRKYHNSNARPKNNKYIIEKNNVCNWTNNDIKILIFSYLNNYYVITMFYCIMRNMYIMISKLNF